MRLSYSSVQVRIAENILWVGGEAYPLGNISHVGQRSLEVNKKRARQKFIAQAVFIVLLGIFFPGEAIKFLFLAVMMAISVWRLTAVLRTPPVYGLVINTAGTQFDAVWGSNQNEIGDLVQEITAAISRPGTVNKIYNINSVQGDLIQLYGKGIGKAQHNGSGNVVVP
ncbi:DUF6232 family protein [Sinosporangium siamense]|uniref:Uncharacterized protein n=1 Tax=Sinosporangium siamense TaxID=1367973 RepID=A0A919RHG6_9ACTN|nr:DUF6232 family protein [Sinosporangium siamense]GII93417.1 hypothetical protein Ssi02_36480 [Sinosporangium siamense]